MELEFEKKVTLSTPAEESTFKRMGSLKAQSSDPKIEKNACVGFLHPKQSAVQCPVDARVVASISHMKALKVLLVVNNIPSDRRNASSLRKGKVTPTFRTGPAATIVGPNKLPESREERRDELKEQGPESQVCKTFISLLETQDNGAAEQLLETTRCFMFAICGSEHVVELGETRF